MRYRTEQKKALGWAGLLLSAAITAAAAWVTHLIWVIKALASDAGATFGQMALGAIGAFMPPVGMVHGVMIWLGTGF